MLLALASDLARGFHLSAEDIIRTTHYLTQQMRDGLKQDGKTQIPSFVTHIPDGTETGTCLAVDLGGTNCRVSLVHLHGDGTYALITAKRSIPADIRINAHHRPLFSFISTFIRDFLTQHRNSLNNAQHYFKLGFTFSFTYTSQSLSQGIMVQWDKGWDIPEAVGRDPCELLQESIDELGLNIRVAALTNDSVGTLLSRAYSSPRPSATLLGAIFGTGTNAAYIERLENIPRLGPTLGKVDIKDMPVMVVNTEWGAMCDSSESPLLKSRCDDVLDSASSNPTMQLLEKQISGLYLGELIRLSILHILDNHLFSMKMSVKSPVYRPYGIDASFLSRIVSTVDHKSTSEEISATLCAQDVSLEDAQAIRQISAAIIARSAQLSGAAVAAIILQSGRLRTRGDDRGPTSSKTSGIPVIASEIVASSTKMNKTMLVHTSLLKRTVCNLLFCFMGSSRVPPYPQVEKGSTVIVKDFGNDQDIIDIGVDGSLYESCPGYENHLRQALRDIPEIGVRGEAKIRIALAKDGSSVGAALVAQSA